MEWVNQWLSSDIWRNKWAAVSYPPIKENYACVYECGTADEPGSTLWICSLCEGLGPDFKEGMKLLDYGCGSARVVNFVSERLKDFTYYGLEPESAFGTKAINHGIQCFGHDPRVKLGYTNSPLEEEAIATADCVILGSVFTHLQQHTIEAILNKLSPVVHRGGVITFSIFIVPNRFHHAPFCGAGGSYDLPDCYTDIHFSREQFDSMVKGYQVTESASFDIHHIFALRK